jgi:hypothetical protein
MQVQLNKNGTMFTIPSLGTHSSHNSITDRCIDKQNTLRKRRVVNLGFFHSIMLHAVGVGLQEEQHEHGLGKREEKLKGESDKRIIMESNAQQKEALHCAKTAKTNTRGRSDFLFARCLIK